LPKRHASNPQERVVRNKTMIQDRKQKCCIFTLFALRRILAQESFRSLTKAFVGFSLFSATNTKLRLLWIYFFSMEINHRVTLKKLSLFSLCLHFIVGFFFKANNFNAA
jgi:hypothetical protein